MNEFKEKEWKVLVSCITFNHAPYIEDAMNGFCMQQTNFPFVCVILDDASTDGEQDVLNSFLQTNFDMEDDISARIEETDDYLVKFARHRTNRNCYFAVFFLKYNHFRKKDNSAYYKELVDNSKYIAICEGDDYWIDRYKLGRQIEFLESNPDYVMCFHNAIVRSQNHSRPDYIMRNFESGDFDTTLLFKKWQLPTASLVYRRNVYNSPIYINRPKGYPGDMTMFYILSCIGKVYGISECMSVYRLHPGGISNAMFKGYCLQLQYNFAKEIGNPQAIKHTGWVIKNALFIFFPKWLMRKEEAKEIYGMAWSSDRKLFIGAFLKIICLWPFLMIKRIIRALWPFKKKR